MPPSLKPDIFQSLLLSWFSQHGRQHLPWQQPRSPYRVWLSEIMLQQTQVNTVIPYFEKFISHFPTVATLAQAQLDQVLSLWAGLGYYARARNLHRAAQQIMIDHQGRFPQTLETLQALPGVGRSTAGAILSLSFNQAAPILDGNVKRVLTRLHAISGWPGSTAVTQTLWTLATQYLPSHQAADYTQAMMDLGALVCTRNQPQCKKCPFSEHCLAYAQDKTHAYPSPKPLKAALPVRTTCCLILRNTHQEVLLMQRPPVGIWGGLWSLPECPPAEDIPLWCQQRYDCHVKSLQYLPSFRHTFTHFHLTIQPVVCEIESNNPPLRENNTALWLSEAQWKTKGLAAPIKKLLMQLNSL